MAPQKPHPRVPAESKRSPPLAAEKLVWFTLPPTNMASWSKGSVYIHIWVGKRFAAKTQNRTEPNKHIPGKGNQPQKGKRHFLAPSPDEETRCAPTLSQSQPRPKGLVFQTAVRIFPAKGGRPSMNQGRDFPPAAAIHLGPCRKISESAPQNGRCLELPVALP